MKNGTQGETLTARYSRATIVGASEIQYSQKKEICFPNYLTCTTIHIFEIF